ncbi:MAG: threonylcarbamoyl-AMP synthase [Clostridiales bacterium]|nr:threonylcarbamoyl-AMP synthase [Clostridiales bacterium]
MITRIEKINPQYPEKDRIQAAAAILRDGGLVAFPTETVYGLGADALRPEAAKRIYAAKGRPSDNPLIVHIADFNALYRIAREIPPQAKALADAFWPGPLTMIFQKTEAVPYETTGGLDTVAVRMPSHPAALALIRESGGYIAAPSANTSGRPSPTLAKHVWEDLSGKIPLILDGGEVGIGIESTILDLSEIAMRGDDRRTADGISGRDGGGRSAEEIPMILRPGYITKEMIADVIGAVREDPGFLAADAQVRPKAPGMKYRHYAPKAELVIVSGDPRKVAERINALAEENHQRGEKTGVLCALESRGRYQADIVKYIGSREDEDSIAQGLYAALREMDALGADRIYAESFSDLRIGSAVMNRLRKAAGQHIMEI